MSQPDLWEVYLEGGSRCIFRGETGYVPDRGDIINLRKKNYRVIGRTFTIDNSANALLSQVICVLNVKEVEE